MLASVALPGSSRPIARSDYMMGKLAKNDVEWVNSYNNRRMRRANVEWLSKVDFSHAITLNINRRISVAVAEQLFKRFCYEVDRYKFGKREVSKLTSESRFFAVASIEHPNTNIHLHVAANLTGWLTERVSPTDVRELHKIWGGCTMGAGSIEIKEIHDRRGWLFYMTKECFYRPLDLIFASDFHPK